MFLNLLVTLYFCTTRSFKNPHYKLINIQSVCLQFEWKFLSRMTQFMRRTNCMLIERKCTLSEIHPNKYLNFNWYPRGGRMMECRWNYWTCACWGLFNFFFFCLYFDHFLCLFTQSSSGAPGEYYWKSFIVIFASNWINIDFEKMRGLRSRFFVCTLFVNSWMDSECNT